MAKKKRSDAAWIARRGLVETRDTEIHRPILRKPGFNGVPTFGEMETSLGRALRAKRSERKLTREQLATMIGLSTQVFGRYEKAISKMNVTRLIHLCEILDVSPVDLIYEAAPHLFGDTPQEAKLRASAARWLWELPASTVAALHDVMVTMIPRS
ncbi:MULTISPECIES: helix-turn-helix domain-containing protein [Chelativorans]|jgi:transcriptional regulator with XRE-family HTH domain|uniref:Transcriptional regulator, XRE family n=1 Tax=Chelativorans sp. (strain BNC1) TaxID=266779 RepID=Q11MZ4_CHESB|nr:MULTISPECIES: helix-turn-helix transcriptional regulator [Chelativorans]